MTSSIRKSKSSRSSEKPKPVRGLRRTVKPSREVPLAELKDDLSRYLRLAEDRDIIITRHGRPAGLLIGFENEDDWFDYRLEHDPRFLRKVSEARADIAAGKGVRLETI
jgi:prevent-host-death family protein